MRAGDESFERLRAAIEELAAGDAAELVAEARAEARARVRSMLTEAMAQSLLEHARAELGDAVPAGRSDPPSARVQRRSDPPIVPRPDPPPVTPADTGGHGWYVYCITDADGAAVPELGGIDPAHRVTLLREGELTAIVSRVSLSEFDEERLRENLGDMAWLERTARRHENVLDAVRAIRTIIPMRLCTIYRDEVGVRAMLDREAPVLHDALAGLRGRAEWGVKVFASDEGGAGASDASDPVEAGGAGAAYMDSRRREHDRRRQAGRHHQEALNAIHARLMAMAVDGLITAPQRPEVSQRSAEMLFSGVYLVEHDREPSFHAELSALQSEYGSQGLELEPTGPWPAYNFVPEAIGVPR